MVSPELPRCCLTSASKIRENGCLRAIVTIIMVTSHRHVNSAMGGGGSSQRREFKGHHAHLQRIRYGIPGIPPIE